MIRLYEKHGLPVDVSLTIQYLQNKEVAKSFALYYDLFNKYKSDYQIDRIFAGNAGDEIAARAKAARFDERLSLLGLLLSGLTERFAAVETEEQVTSALLEAFKEVRGLLAEKDADAAFGAVLEQKQNALTAGKQAGKLSRDEQHKQRKTIAALEQARQAAVGSNDPMPTLRDTLAARREAQKALAAETGAALENTFAFCEQAFGEGQELLILVTELTANGRSAHFIARNGSEGYYRHNKALLVYERQEAILRELDELEPETL